MTKESQHRSLTIVEQNAIDKVKARARINKGIVRVVKSNDSNSDAIESVQVKDLSPIDQEQEFQARVYSCTGTASQQIGLRLLARAADALTTSSDSTEDSVKHMNIVAKAMQALEPQDEIEGQLISQLVVLHDQCMSWLGRAMRTERVDFANTYLNGASKLLTRHHETLATLLKYRRRGEQRVHVEHVHVHGGAQAIVGNVGTGGGLNRKVEEGPHAKV